ncbi:MAG: Hsp20/alpha crystallin family protein [Candidatus Latescibacteria bacterium]|nr:Hsp20/alpha crystallin family protein [Candidatus Latescibacterota bacterium]
MLPDLWRKRSALSGPTMNDFIDRFFYGWPSYDATTDLSWTPRVDINENEKDVVIEAELPGIEKKDIKVEVKDNVLTLSGERKQEKKTENSENCCIERNYGKFERSFSLGDMVETDKVSAAYKNGVLTLTLPKKEQAIPKEITVEVK